MPVSQPPCGLYRTTRALEGVAPGRLVYFHNHGDPGPGIYLPQDWNLNRARWQQRGFTVPDADWASSLTPLRAEGLYRVEARFFCCEKQCRSFETSMLVQLGYNGDGDALLFVPEWAPSGLGFPARGTRVDAAQLGNLTALNVAEGETPPPSPAGGLLH